MGKRNKTRRPQVHQKRQEVSHPDLRLGDGTEIRGILALVIFAIINKINRPYPITRTILRVRANWLFIILALGYLFEFNQSKAIQYSIQATEFLNAFQWAIANVSSLN